MYMRLIQRKSLHERALNEIENKGGGGAGSTAYLDYSSFAPGRRIRLAYVGLVVGLGHVSL